MNGGLAPLPPKPRTQRARGEILMFLDAHTCIGTNDAGVAGDQMDSQDRYPRSQHRNDPHAVPTTRFLPRMRLRSAGHARVLHRLLARDEQRTGLWLPGQPFPQ